MCAGFALAGKSSQDPKQGVMTTFADNIEDLL